jgi:hypothetical protein
MLDNTKGGMKKDIPEKLATYDTQDTGQINVREYQRGNKNEQTVLCTLCCQFLSIALVYCPFGNL